MTTDKEKKIICENLSNLCHLCALLFSGHCIIYIGPSNYGKNKLEKFADMASYPHVFEYPYSAVDNVPFDMKGNWHGQFFKNDHPIVLELGCGRGEYTVGLGRMFPEKNFIGVDIKGARMWTGATESLQSEMKNVAFLRTNIEIIDRVFCFG